MYSCIFDASYKKPHNKIVKKYCSKNRHKYFKPCKRIALD